MDELADRYEAHAERYYRKPTVDGGMRSTNQAQAIRYALRPLREVAGKKRPGGVRAEDLYACQSRMIEYGYCRGNINRHIRRIRTAFRWAAQALFDRIRQFVSDHPAALTATGRALDRLYNAEALRRREERRFQSHVDACLQNPKLTPPA